MIKIKKYFFLILGVVWLFLSFLIYVLIERGVDLNVHLVYFMMYSSGIIYLLALINLLFIVFKYYAKR